MDHFEKHTDNDEQESGRFRRSPSRFREWIRSDHSSPFLPEPRRYRLYVSLACPWAHRTLIARQLLQLRSAIGLSIVDPVMREGGWRFSDAPGCIPDPVCGAEFLRELYEMADPNYSGRWTVPVLWDTKTETIVNNESREILRMMTTELRSLSASRVNLLPAEDVRRIDETLDWLYDGINDAVYRVGFARTQAAYDEAIEALYDSLDAAERRLAEDRFLCGPTLTEADICLFTTLYRFEPVYAIHFKCSLRPLSAYPNLSGFLRDVYQIPGVATTCDLDHVKQHYYRSHPQLNPLGIVPRGPERDLDRPHRRDLVGRRDGAALRIDPLR